MPDKRRHRGAHPEDEALFAEADIPRLRTAVSEFSWLLSRGYAEPSGLKIVGDRHDLTVRQRMAVRRSSCATQALRRRRETLIDLGGASTSGLLVDGYNLLITIESALAGGVLIVGLDGCCRDLASVHGTYRKVQETLPALTLIAAHCASRGVTRIDWYLDKPVSNSGRLRALIQSEIGPGAPGWSIHVVSSPDRALIESERPVVTSDSGILDRCGQWANVASDIVETRIQGAWRIDLRGT